MINSALRFLIREHRRKPFGGAALVLGRQQLFARHEQVLRIFAEEGVAPRWTALDASDTSTAGPISDRQFFQLLGFASLEALDFADFEGAEITHDLNRPVPQELVGRYDLIVDAGTTEHVFDVRQALVNYASMLKTGGRIFHSSPANNQLNHGFYQLSPGLYFDFYASNRFHDLRGFVVAHDVKTHFTRQVELYEYRPEEYHPEIMTSEKQLSVMFIAEKGPDSTTGETPIQGVYERFAGRRSNPGAGPPSFAPHNRVVSYAKRLVPATVKRLLRPLVIKDPSKRPWGMKLSARL
jgi:hypothetical protein